MATVISAQTFKSFKERLKLVDKIKTEMHRGNYRHKIEIDDDDEGCIVCFYDDRERIHNY